MEDGMSVENEAREALAWYESGIGKTGLTGEGPLQFPAPDLRERDAGRRVARALRVLLDSRLVTDEEALDEAERMVRHELLSPRPVTAQPNEREALASEFVEILNAVWHHQQDVLGAAHKIATRLSPAALTQSEVVEWEYGCRSSVHRLNADRGGVPLPWGVEPAEHGETCPSPSLARRQKAGPWLALEAVAPSPTDHTDGN